MNSSSAAARIWAVRAVVTVVIAAPEPEPEHVGASATSHTCVKSWVMSTMPVAPPDVGLASLQQTPIGTMRCDE